MIKRLFDLILSLILVILFSPIIIAIMILIRISSKGPALHWSKRIGVNNQIFMMPKFRSMYLEAPDVATHLFKDSDTFITPMGKVLRKTSIDELPQFWSILIGKMSFVGPRPALYNQDDLIELRTKKGIEKLSPGLTGWAQINGRDDITIPEKVELDYYYFQHRSFLFDIRIIIKTFVKVVYTKGISH